ncbi:choice-of-anchor D domain-containing protein [Variovorax sp. YR752]|uniref:choice-of-anchor D domain-containing protein n=1 Tax=Variovorax sp. YR752 TaxID=1884383 RepID=UPI00313834F9
MRLSFVFLASLLAASLTAPPARAQSAASGETLYGTPAVAGKLSCSANACHGSTTQPQNRIANGLHAATIKAATGRVAQMRFLENQLGDAQYNDIAAFLAAKLGGTPSYLQVVAMPMPSLAPDSLAFGALDLLVTSPAQAVTVRNATSASAPLVLGSIATTAGSDFAVSGGTCRSGDSLPVGASCTVLVTFTPTARGNRSAELRVVHNGSAAQSTMSLSGVGTGTLPVITLSPPALSFSQTVGSTSADLRLLVGNSGTGMLRLGALALTGAQAGEFALGEGDCAAGTTLGGGQSCAVTLRFTPAASGQRRAELTIEHNALGGSSSVALSGWGNSSAQPGLLLDANRIDMGDQVVAVPSSERVLGVVNNGQAALEFSSIALSGTQAGDFALGGTCAVGTPLPAQGSCTVTIRITPATLGARAATLRIAGNAPGGTASVSLAAAGVPTPAPAVTLSQAALGFGTVSIGGRSAPRTVVLGNSGNGALDLTGLTVSSTEFKLTHDCPASLAVGASCSLAVVYAPAGANASEVLTIRSNAPSSPNQIVLNGLGSSATLAVLDWSEGSAPIAFDDAEVGATTAAVLRTLVNRGPGSVTLSTLSVAGTDPGSFVLGGGSCAAGTVLAVDARCTVGLRFAPSAPGERSAVLQIASTGSSPAEVALSGTGSGFAVLQPPLGVTPAALDYSHLDIATGTRSDALVLRIVNDGTADSTIAAVTTSAGFVVAPADGSEACPGVPWTLPPGAGCRVAVVFAPTSGGSTKGTLRVETSAGRSTEVALSGAAVTTMSNAGQADSGAGAIGAGWLLLLGLAIAALRRAGTTPSLPSRTA